MKTELPNIINEEVKRVSRERNEQIRHQVSEWQIKGIVEGFYPKLHFEIRNEKEYLCMEKLKL